MDIAILDLYTLDVGLLTRMVDKAAGRIIQVGALELDALETKRTVDIYRIGYRELVDDDLRLLTRSGHERQGTGNGNAALVGHDILAGLECNPRA